MQHRFFLLYLFMIFVLCVQPSSSASDACNEGTYCPSHCNNSTGELRGSLCCITPPICCNLGEILDCCHEPDKQIESVVMDGWNCVNNFQNRTPIQVLTTALIWLGAVVGVVAVIGTITVFTAQKVKQKRAQRRRSESAVSCTCDIMDPPTATSNPVDDIILHPIVDSPPPYSLVDTLSNPSSTIPAEDPPSYDEAATTSDV